MWFRLASANWTTTGNLGTMDSISGSWTVTCTTSGGIVKTTGDGMVTKGGTWTGTFTLSEGATFTSATLTPSSAGTVTSTPSGSTVTVKIENVSANCTLAVVATGGSSSGGSGGTDSGDGGTTTPATSETLVWTNQSYSSSAGLVSNNQRACAKFVCKPFDVITVHGLDGYSGIDLIGFKADGTPTSNITVSSTPNIQFSITDGTLTFYIPGTMTGFNESSGMAYVCLTMKNSSGSTIDISTLPQTYTHRQLAFRNEQFSSASNTFVTSTTRITLQYTPVGANRTITITNIPQEYLDLTPVDCVSYDANKTFIAASSGATASISGTTLTLTLPSSVSDAAYVKVSMKSPSAGSSEILLRKFINCIVSST